MTFRYVRIALFFLLAASGLCHAQLNISTTSNPSTLINTIVGSGVTVTNVTLNCNGQATGVFTASSTNLGLSSGIIMATGKATEAKGPNNSAGGSNSNCFNSNSSFFDPQIGSIEPLATYDGCLLEFNIKPVCNTLQINYVFASEEYPEFVCSDYNDAFGFFISGPNPSGGNYNSYNIARLPNGSPVAINYVNGGSVGSSGTNSNCGSLSNTAYYVDNSGGSTIQYDGFTTPLTASASVKKCEWYHLKLVIADAGDCYYSSAVFLSAKGITCPQSEVPSVSASSTDLQCGDDGTASVNITNSTGPITYNWQPGGQTTATATNLAAGTYTCTVGFTDPCPYNQNITTTLSAANAFTVTTNSQNAHCDNPDGTAEVHASGGIPPYSIPQWNNAQNGDTAVNLIPGTYSVTVTDAGGCTLTRTVTVGNTVPTITLDSVIVNTTCNTNDGSIELSNINGGNSPYTFNWNTSPPSTTQNIYNLNSGNYSVVITDIDNCKKNSDFVVLNYDSVFVQSTSMDEYCFKSDGEIDVHVINGIAPYTWTWSQDSLLNDSVATGLSAGDYIYSVTDQMGCVTIDTITVNEVVDYYTYSPYTIPREPVANSNFIVGTPVPSPWNVDYIQFSDGYIYTDTNEAVLNYENYGYYDATFYMISDNGCRDTVPYTFFVKDFMTIYIPNAFTPNGDRFNGKWFVYGTLVRSIEIYVYDRWGMLIFESHDLETGWDGTFKGNKCQQDVYVYKVKATDYFDQDYKYAGQIRLIR